MNRYELLLDAYAARDQFVLILVLIVLAILITRLVITRNPAGLNQKWQQITVSLWDAYILTAYVGVLGHSLFWKG